MVYYYMYIVGVVGYLLLHSLEKPRAGGGGGSSVQFPYAIHPLHSLMTTIIYIHTYR